MPPLLFFRVPPRPHSRTPPFPLFLPFLNELLACSVRKTFLLSFSDCCRERQLPLFFSNPYTEIERLPPCCHTATKSTFFFFFSREGMYDLPLSSFLPGSAARKSFFCLVVDVGQAHAVSFLLFFSSPPPFPSPECSILIYFLLLPSETDGINPPKNPCWTNNVEIHSLPRPAVRLVSSLFFFPSSLFSEGSNRCESCPSFP